MSKVVANLGLFCNIPKVFGLVSDLLVKSFSQRIKQVTHSDIGPNDGTASTVASIGNNIDKLQSYKR
jgi:hypothetical protein